MKTGNYNTPEMLDFFNDDGGLIMAALCMHEVVDEQRERIHETFECCEGAYFMRDVSKAFGAVAQVIDEDLTNTGELLEISTECWEALGCDSFDWSYMELVLDWFCGEGKAYGEAILQSFGCGCALYAAGEALHEFFLPTIEAYITWDKAQRSSAPIEGAKKDA